jgi:hypothetical protein
MKEKDAVTAAQKVSTPYSTAGPGSSFSFQQKEKEEKKKEDNQLTKSVKDRFASLLLLDFLLNDFFQYEDRG